jgi:hypothetical protein
MIQTNPYEVPRAPLADVPLSLAKRPMVVTISLVLLWTLLAFTALGSIAHLSRITNVSDMGSIGYIAYLAGMVLVPGFLLVKVAQARNWARIAIVVLYAMNLLFRVFLGVIGGQYTLELTAWIIVPAVVQAIAFVMLFLPGANRWFRHATQHVDGANA